ncbi:NACHT domain-containing protein [Fusarium austroafricanum]|uniref:NACHT domain-containing protein n=1 Tax=Fusarium austroafricanum TaxID=2364996 RepID=A0A8H4KPK2_9HYPO|nr:NACHT domain-containing protein [Fusarium austroafricanum]
MIKQLEKEISGYKNHSRFAGLCRKLDRFASLFAPFFSVVGTFVQSNPEYSALAWGAIRLVFLLGTNFTTFLDKILSMFEKLGDRLPGYAEYYERVVVRWKKVSANDGQRASYEARTTRMVKALSYVYADILQFCQEACRIFSTKSGGSRYKPSIIADIFWKPFDIRFAELLDRLESHQALFNNEMQLEESRFLEMQYDKREADAGLAGEAMGQIKAQVEDLQQQIESREDEISSALARLETRLEAMFENTKQGKGGSTHDANVFKTRLLELESWIDAPNYLDALERSKSNRTPDTCEWFTASQEYKTWKSLLFLDMGPASIEPILYVTGKPGFGKTTLSSFLIEDLNVPSQSSQRLNGVLYYHFSSDKSQSHLPNDALRAFLNQVIRKYWDHQDIIDAVSVLYEDKSVGQARASGNQILQCLQILMRDFEDIVFLVDGVDECSNPPDLLRHLAELCEVTFTKAMVLSRPSIDLPPEFERFTPLHLDATKNKADIALYLRPHVQSLVKRSLLSTKHTVEELVEIIATKSSGMFLWASLTMRFLNCKVLSLNDRRDAIFFKDTVEGIEGLYSAILDILCKSGSIHRERVIRILWILAVAKRPLSISEITIALAIRPGKVTDVGDFVPALKENISFICGALVEVLDHGYVCFIHPSLRDFLTSDSDYMRQSPFYIDIAVRHLDLAAICLSHIIFDLPRSPLSLSDKDTTSHTRSVARVLFPFLEYSLLWVHHAIQGFQNMKTTCTTVSHQSGTKFMSFLEKLMHEKLSLMVWVEASWTFDCPPLLSSLQKDICSSPLPSVPVPETGPMVLFDLAELDSDLLRLHREWHHLLSTRAGAIWESSITTFLRSRFFIENHRFRVSSFSTPTNMNSPAHQAILLQSKVSDTGLILGIIAVTPSPIYATIMKRIFGTKSCSLTSPQREALISDAKTGWKLIYEQKSIRTEKTVAKIEYELPAQDIEVLLRQGLSSNRPHRFPFPVGLSNDLSRLAILRTVITVSGVESGSQGDTINAPQTRIQHLGQQRTSNWGYEHADAGLAYSPVFSPSGDALAFVINKEPTGQIQQRHIELWAKEDLPDQDNDYTKRGSVITSWIRRSDEHDENGSFGFIFHPILPVLVYSSWISLTAWQYLSKDVKDPFIIHGKGPRLPGIPEAFCGKHPDCLIYSFWSARGVKEEVMEHERISRLAPAPGRTPSETMPTYCHEHLCIYDILPKGNDGQLNHMSIRTALAIRVLEESRGLSCRGLTLHRDRAINAVVFHTKNDTGQSERHILTHLPRLRTDMQTFVSLINPSHNDKWIRMIWNKSPEQTYSLNDTPHPYLPCIIDVERGTDKDKGTEFKRLRRLSP